MKILFISSNLIGDTILSTGVLSFLYQNNKNSKITLVTGPTARQLFDNFPNIEKIVIVRKKQFNLHWLILWSKLIKCKWDLVIDLRSSFLSYLLFSKKRKIFKRNDKPITQVEKLSYFIKANHILNPIIYPSKEDKDLARLLIKNRIAIAISPGGNWIPKIWLTKNFNKLIIELQILYQQKRLIFLIIGSKKEEKEYFNQVVENISKDSIVNIMGKSLTFTYACLSLCRLFIGNDSGLMHLAAASGTSTIGLFGPTRDDWYRPYGKKCYVVRTKESYNELRNNLKDSNKSLMSSITINDLMKIIDKNKLIE